MNKVISKQIFRKNKIRTPNFFILKKENNSTRNIKNLMKIKNIQLPVVVKPINEGSSIGVKICKNFFVLRKFVNKLLKKYEEIILESFVGGQEIQVAVINGLPLGAIELIPKREFYDYKAKYTKSARTKHLCLLT